MTATDDVLLLCSASYAWGPIESWMPPVNCDLIGAWMNELSKQQPCDAVADRGKLRWPIGKSIDSGRRSEAAAAVECGGRSRAVEARQLDSPSSNFVGHFWDSASFILALSSI